MVNFTRNKNFYKKIIIKSIRSTMIEKYEKKITRNGKIYNLMNK